MRVYTGYFGKIKYYSGVTPVSVAITKPAWNRECLEEKSLAPGKWIFTWKDKVTEYSGDKKSLETLKEEYVERYRKDVLESRFNEKKTLHGFLEEKYGRLGGVILCCYEKYEPSRPSLALMIPGKDFCHRHVLSESQTLTATGTTPITWSIESGSLPGGLSLSNNTISGTPTTTGSFNFTVIASNATGSDTKQLSIVIASSGGGDYVPGSIELVSINGGTFTMGSLENEQYRQSGETQHSVTLSSFKIGNYEVTQEQYQAVTGTRKDSCYRNSVAL